MPRHAVGWLLERARPAPGALQRSAPWVREILDHDWAPMQALAGHVRCLPGPLFGYLLGCAGGWVLITGEGSRYVPGPATLPQRKGGRSQPYTVQDVAFVSLEDLARDNERPLHVIGHLIDHQLGSGRPNPDRRSSDLSRSQPWLSDGGGVSALWQEAGARLQRLYALGYGVDAVARADPHEYLAQSLAWYCRDRPALEVADPQICKWFRSTLWSEGFWQEARNPELKS